MLLVRATFRDDKRNRRARIQDAMAAHHMGDFAKTLMKDLDA
jgi:predicted alpha-1,6-mannanase (GH76 family)